MTSVKTGTEEKDEQEEEIKVNETKQDRVEEGKCMMSYGAANEWKDRSKMKLGKCMKIRYGIWREKTHR